MFLSVVPIQVSVNLDVFNFYFLNICWGNHYGDLFGLTFSFKQRYLRIRLLWAFEWLIGKEPEIEWLWDDGVSGWCYDCGSELEEVRPGKYQCPECG